MVHSHALMELRKCSFLGPCVIVCGTSYFLHLAHKAWSELCKSRRDVRMQIAFRFSNRPLLFPTTVKPDVRDPVEVQNITRRGRPPKVASVLPQGDELSEASSRVTKRARQSTLSFVTPGDRMDE
jgi:hypothetical protein